jgi:hypothetical protein
MMGAAKITLACFQLRAPRMRVPAILRVRIRMPRPKAVAAIIRPGGQRSAMTYPPAAGYQMRGEQNPDRQKQFSTEAEKGIEGIEQNRLLRARCIYSTATTSFSTPSSPPTVSPFDARI